MSYRTFVPEHRFRAPLPPNHRGGGALSDSTVVKVTFKNIKTKKSTTKKYRCVVKPAEIKEYQIVSAEATGVKTITVTMNKDVTLTDDVKITVAKGAADRKCKATASGKVITLAMDAKLIAGDYTVTIKGLETKDLTANVNVAKDETLTSYKVSSVATMARNAQNKATVSSNSAIVTYEALNQYNERMNASTPQISCTLGKVANIKDSTATAAGSFTVTDIPAVMAIQGTKGTVIIVDKTTGVNANQEVTVSAAATPSTVEIAGVYNANSNKIEDLQAGANLSSGNYYILFTAKDQYDNDFTDAATFQAITTASVAGGLTNVAVKTDNTNKAIITTRTVDGKDYLAIQLTNAVASSNVAKAGSYNLTIVNQEKGMLLNNSYTVADAVIIKSVNISADKGLYLGSGEQELTYEITDQNGNAVTSYAVLNNTSVIKFSDTYGKFSFKKNADGTAKLVYNPDKNGTITPVGNDDKKSAIVTETVQANDQTSSNLIVKPLTFTVYQAKIAKSVSKLKDGTATSLALNNTLKISLGDIVYSDQYGNELAAKDAKPYALDNADHVVVGKTSGWGTSVAIDQQPANGFASAGLGTGDDANKLVFKSGSKTATATVYLKYGENVTAGSGNYDYKFTVTATDTKGIDASTLKIKSVNGGKMIKVANAGDAATLTVDQIEVIGKIGGNDTVIPSSQYVIKSYKDNKISTDEAAKGTKTKTATVVIQVTTQDANGNRTETELSGTFKFTLDATPSIAKVDSVNDTAKNAGLTASANVVSAGALKALFNYKDQFGDTITYTNDTTAGAGSVLITADVSELPDGANADDCVIVGSGTANVTITFGAAGTYKISVKATIKDADGNVTSEKDCVVEIKVPAATTTP